MATEEPSGIPVFLNSQAYGIQDRLNPGDGTAWCAGNDAAVHLERCLEALRDVHEQVELMLTRPPERRRRATKHLATFLLNLVEAVNQLGAELNNHAQQYSRVRPDQWRTLRQALKMFHKQVPHEKGQLRDVRRKISAHLDLDQFNDTAAEAKVWDLVEPHSYLDWLEATMRALEALLAVDAYSWDRLDAPTGAFSHTETDGFEMLIGRDDAGEPDFKQLGFNIIRSPKYEVGGLLDQVATMVAQLRAG